MKNNKYQHMKQYIIYSLIAIGLLTLNACEDLNSFHDPYLKEPTVYRSKPDSYSIKSGNKQAQVSWTLSIDKAIVKTIITIDGVDKREFPIVRQNAVDTFTQVLTNLTEGTHAFSIRNEDANGNSSLPVNVSADVFGDNYQSSLSVRNYNAITAVTTVPTGLKITWNGPNPGDVGMELTFINKSNVSVTLTVLRTDLETTLTNVKPLSTVTYKSFYKPNETCIDTFVVQKSFVLPL